MSVDPQTWLLVVLVVCTGILTIAVGRRHGWLLAGCSLLIGVSLVVEVTPAELWAYKPVRALVLVAVVLPPACGAAWLWSRAVQRAVGHHPSGREPRSHVRKVER